MKNIIENRILKYIFFGFLIIIVIFCIVFVKIVYDEKYRISNIDTILSRDGAYQLVLKQIGTPIFPYGPVKGKVVLMRGNEVVAKYDFLIANDGVGINKDNWKVSWGENGADIIISGSEQEDMKISMSYNGNATNN